ncbi:hypothetical protein MTO96_014475 [Rhipicephalus appendiculatus]
MRPSGNGTDAPGANSSVHEIRTEACAAVQLAGDTAGSIHARAANGTPSATSHSESGALLAGDAAVATWHGAALDPEAPFLNDVENEMAASRLRAAWRPGERACAYERRCIAKPPSSPPPSRRPTLKGRRRRRLLVRLLEEASSGWTDEVLQPL